MFTRSPVNAASYSAGFNPVGLFIDKVKAFEKPFEQMAPDKVKRLLTQQGVDVNKVDVAQSIHVSVTNSKDRLPLVHPSL